MINNYPVDLEVYKPKLQLCRNDLNRTVIGNIKEAYNIVHKLSLGNVNELSFSIPFKINYRNQHKRNKNEPEIKERRIIKLTKGTFHEYYIVHKITKVFDDGDEHKQIECYSLAYELADKLVKDLSLVSKNATTQLNTVLAETNWTLGYIDADFDLKYRGLETSSSKVLDAIQQIAQTFNALIIYDTVNREVSFYDFEKYGQYKGLGVKYGKLLKNITYESNTAEYCTRLKITGKDGIGIQSVNSTGAGHLDDYSSLLYGFQRNSDKSVITHAENISDSLANALLDYQILVDSKQGEYTTLLNNLNAKNLELITAEGQLVDLESELAVIEDSIITANRTGGNPTPYVTQKNTKLSQISTKNTEINNIKSQITTIRGQITTLNNLLKVESNFTSDNLKEWNSHIVVKEYSNEFIDDPQQLLEAGKKELEKLREPKIVVSIGIVNLLEVLDEYRNWDKLVLGDIIRIYVDRIGVNINAKILEMTFDHENADLQISIGNVREILSDEERVLKDLYKTISSSTTFENNKYKYLDGLEKANSTYQMLQGKLDATKIRIEAAFDESITIDRKGLRAKSPSNPNDVLILTSGVLAISNTGGNYWNTAIDASGVYADRLHGKILAGNNLTIENSSGSFLVNANGVTITNMDLTLTTSTVKSRIKINPTDGIRIQANTGTTGSPNWIDRLYADASGNLIANNLTVSNISVTSGSMGWGNWSINSAGNLVASNATISGNVTANSIVAGASISSPTINGGNIIGTTIQSFSGNKNITISGNQLIAYDSNGARRFSINDPAYPALSSLTFYRSNGSTLSGQIYQTGNQLSIDSLSDPIYFFGNVYFTNANAFNLKISSVDGLQSSLDGKASLSSLALKSDISYNEGRYGYNLSFDTFTRNLKMFAPNGTQLAIVNIPS